jgi:hypothetical protein
MSSPKCSLILSEADLTTYNKLYLSLKVPIRLIIWNTIWLKTFANKQEFVVSDGVYTLSSLVNHSKRYNNYKLHNFCKSTE